MAGSEPEVAAERKPESAAKRVTSLEGFEYERTLADFPREKVITVLGCFPAISADQPAIVKIQKLPLDDSQWPALVSPSGVALKYKVSNNEYHQFSGALGASDAAALAPLNGVKVDITCPATQRHIDKATASTGRLVVRETAALYERVTRPFIEERPASWEQWVRDLVAGVKEKERMLFQDADQESGFVLHPDFKWHGSGFGSANDAAETVFDPAAVDLKSLYCLAVSKRPDVRSLRDLRAAHLPLLRNICAAAPKHIRERYGVPHHQLRLFVHYYPSFYHFHVHVVHVCNDGMNANIAHCHLLEDVIAHLEADSDWYSKATLVCDIPEKHPLSAKFAPILAAEDPTGTS